MVPATALCPCSGISLPLSLSVFFCFQCCSTLIFQGLQLHCEIRRPRRRQAPRCVTNCSLQKSTNSLYNPQHILLTLGPGAFAIYLEPWHADVEVPLSPCRSSRAQLFSSFVLTSNQVFLELRKNHGSEEHRARDLFYALWIPDIFMRRVEAEAQWSLFCPTEAPGLYSTLFMRLKRYAHFAL
jgi:hypothetical protein